MNLLTTTAKIKIGLNPVCKAKNEDTSWCKDKITTQLNLVFWHYLWLKQVQRIHGCVCVCMQLSQTGIAKKKERELMRNWPQT